MRTAFAPQVLNKGHCGIVPPQVLTVPPCTPMNSSPLMLAPRSCSGLPPPSMSLLPLTVTTREPPELEPPELEPPELEPPELEPPELEPPELEPPELEPPELEPPELEPPELELPELEPLPAWTVKSRPEKLAPPGAITASCCAPSGASAGTVAVISLALTTENVASWALPIHTAVAPVKALPVRVSPDPMAPALGAKLVIWGAAWACCSTVKLVPEKAAPPGTITASCCAPSGASAGTVAVISLALTTKNVASCALPIHTAVAPVKALPVRVSPDPMAPALGARLVIWGLPETAAPREPTRD